MTPENTDIRHRIIKTNGINLHIAEQGSGPIVLLLHGFPEFWYSWRHQIPVLAKAGYHVVAPDMRGYGQSDIPQGVEKYTALHIVGDLIGLLDALGEKQAFVVGHDWGAFCAWNLCLMCPHRVRAVVALSAPFNPRSPISAPVENMKFRLGEGYYVCRFQEPGRAEADFAHSGYKSFLKKVLCINKGDLWIAPPDKEISEIIDEPTELPPWISEKEIQYYVEQFEKTGFTGGLNYYRVLNLNWELMAPWTGAQVVTPALLIAADRDVVYCTPGVRDYVHSKMKENVPNLHKVVVLEETAHFMQQQNPEVVNGHILGFLEGFHK